MGGYFALLFLLFLSFQGVFASSIHQKSLEKVLNQKSNVVLITLDGVRWQEFFGRPDSLFADDDSHLVFENFWEHFANRGFIFGNPKFQEVMNCSNPYNLSLPAYQSIMVGSVQPCEDNNCGQVREETFPERLLRGLSLRKQDVVTIASWKKIAHAVEHTPGTILVNSGVESFPLGSDDPEIRRINLEQRRDLPLWPDARYDRFTFNLSKYYLKKYNPRFLYISFNDSDEWGHLDDYFSYLSSLKQYDSWLAEIFSILDGMGEYGKNTTVIVTTDHGRGSGEDWTEHGPYAPASKRIWLYAKTSSLIRSKVNKWGAINNKPLTHVDIRPTIEALFGLKPHSCATCGEVISQIFSQY